jgi:hypothetical protein
LGEWGVRKSAVIAVSALALAIVPMAALADEPMRRVNVTAAIDTLYDSNILRRSAVAGVALRGVAEDFRSSPSVTVDFELPLGRQSLLLAGSAGYDFYARNPQLERERIDLLTGVVLRAGRSCSAKFTGQFARQQSELADFVATDPITNAQERRAFEAVVGCKPAFGLSQSFSYLAEQTQNSDPGRQRGNFAAETVSVSLGYARPSFGELSVFTTYRRGRYPARLVIPGGNISERISVYKLQARHRLSAEGADFRWLHHCRAQLGWCASLFRSFRFGGPDFFANRPLEDTVCRGAQCTAIELARRQLYDRRYFRRL